MTVSNFTHATDRVLRHAGCGGSFQRTGPQLICDRCQWRLVDPSEISSHEPPDLPLSRRGYPGSHAGLWGLS